MGAAVAELVSAGTEAEAVPVAKPDGPAALMGAELVPLVMGKTGGGAGDWSGGDFDWSCGRSDGGLGWW